MPITSSTSSPPDSGFTPRKEFIRDQQSLPKTFAILALSSSNFLRLYSFSQSVIDSLQRLFEKQGISIACREDVPQNLYELSVDQKPWANPKSVFSEKLLLEIFTVIYQSDYTFLSCIDYGREPDDRLAMTFSRPATRTGTPLVPGGSPAPDGSRSSLSEKTKKLKRIPFALSFSSTTVMRVISPPLHLTPAILQAVRGSWPRGVVSEKKVADNCFEFKLKGYKWFQEDNFASDSLQHILSLLTSLDAQSFTLTTSLSLTNRSRVKDLWIFTGPAPACGEDFEQEDAERSNEPRRLFGGGSSASSDTPSPNQHGRLASEGYTPTQAMHTRSATEDVGQRQQTNAAATPYQPQLLRKPAPRAQVPVSVIQDFETGADVEEDGYAYARINLPSIISSDSPNMTGIGAAGQGQDTSYPFGSIDRTSPHGGPTYSSFPPSNFQRPRSSNDHHSTPPYSSPPIPQWPQIGSNNASYEFNPKPVFPVPHSLLSPGTFRDSGLSSQSDMSQDIPIKWTGSGKEGGPDLTRLRSGSASSPSFPGGWQATPVEERQRNDSFGHPEPVKVQTPIHETLSRIEAPEVVQPNVALRQSEAVVFGMIAATSTAPPPLLHSPRRSPLVSQGERLSSKTPNENNQGGQGWVLVNVEGSRAASPLAESGGNSAPRETSFVHPSTNGSEPRVNRTFPLHEPSAAAKAIAAMDAIDSRHKKSKSVAANRELGEGGSGVRRFFSLNRKNSRKLREGETGASQCLERTLSESKPGSATRTLRDRLRVRREDL